MPKMPIAGPFSISGNFPIDSRLNMTMKEMKETQVFPDGYITVNSESGSSANNGLWVYSKTYSACEDTGRWRKVCDTTDLTKVWNAVNEVSGDVKNLWTNVSSLNNSAKAWNTIPSATWNKTDRIFVIKDAETGPVWTVLPEPSQLSAGDNINIYEESGVKVISAKNTTDMELDNGLLNFTNGVLDIKEAEEDDIDYYET